MPTILDVVARGLPAAGRNVTLKDKLKQLQRIGLKNRVRQKRRLDSDDTAYYDDAFYESLSLSSNIKRLIDRMTVDNTRYLNKCYDDIALGRRPKGNCIQDWYDMDWIKHLNKETKDAIRNVDLDPLMYTENNIPFIRNHAIKKVNGEL